MSDLSEEPLSELVVRQINREFLRGAAETLTPGVYRRGQNTVGGYTPPDQGDVPGLMRSFAEWLQHGTDHPLVAAGLAHVHLVATHPFWDGNGRTARALEALVIQRSPFHFRKLLSMEKQLLDGRARYFAALDRTLGLAFGEYDATPWLEFYLATLSREADRLISTLETWHHGIEGLHEAAGAGELLPRQAEALVLLLRAGELTRADYAEVAGVSAVTASRDLRELMARGWVTAEGATTTRRYLAGAKLGSLLQGGDQR
jgi:Fic family protein